MTDAEEVRLDLEPITQTVAGEVRKERIALGDTTGEQPRSRG